ncbi:hypothetical protein JCM30394_33260 [Deferrisoma palaeochoriense]
MLGIVAATAAAVLLALAAARARVWAAGAALDKARAMLGAYSGVSAAVFAVATAPRAGGLFRSDSEAVGDWPSDGTPKDWRGEARVRIWSLDAVPSVALQPTVVAALLDAGGDDTDRSGFRARDTVADWADPDDLKRLNGAEAWEYRSRGLPYTPRNAPLQTKEELLLVLGVSPQRYEDVRERVVYWGAPLARVAAMDPAVWGVLYGDDVAAALSDLRASGVLDARRVAGVLGPSAPEDLWDEPVRKVRVVSEAEVGDARERLEVLVSAQPWLAGPLEIWEWRR